MVVDQTSSVEQVITLMNQVVARDGGLITLRSYDPGQALEVDYRVEVNEDCPTCTVSGAMLETFLAESLRSHGVAVEKVIVSER